MIGKIGCNRHANPTVSSRKPSLACPTVPAALYTSCEQGLMPDLTSGVHPPKLFSAFGGAQVQNSCFRTPFVE